MSCARFSTRSLVLLPLADIGQFNADGTLSIIDRKKNIFKLSQGEYVAAEYLEQVFGKCKWVSQIFVYGDSLQSSLVAVVVPNFENIKPKAAELALPAEEDPFCKDEKARKFVLDELAKTGKEAKIKGFEFIKGVHLEHHPFSIDNGLLTPTFKPKRADLQKHYQAQIKDMYAAIVAAAPPEK